MNQSVTLETYNPSWIDWYKHESKQIQTAIGDWVLDIQHIGSTSIPGMVAKPILDILVGVEDLTAFPEAAIEVLSHVGYWCRGDAGVSGRLFFRKDDSFVCHLHVVQMNGEYWQHKVLFRDFLLAFPEKAAAYAQLKRDLAEQYPEERSTYTKLKGPFVEKIVREAQVWQQETSCRY